MFVPPRDHSPRYALPIAVIASVLVHVIALVWPAAPPSKPTQPQGRLSARIAAPPKVVPPQPRTPVPPAPEPAPVARTERVERPPAPTPKRRVLTRRPSQDTAKAPADAAPPKFSVTEKQEMDRFLDSLEKEQKERAESGPSLAERALADARSIARERPAARGDAEEDSSGPISVERVPGSPDISPFSLEMYLDGLVNKLNRSSAFVKRNNGRGGLSKAAAELKINPDGSIGGFEVLAMGDQQDEIAYIDRLVHRAAPYSPFPPDIAGSARSMRILICVIPAGEGGVGFTRKRSGRGC